MSHARKKAPMRRLMPILFKLHRWLGIMFGLMAFLWFASGIVVHWYKFEEPSDAEFLQGFNPPLEASEIERVAWPPAKRLAREIESAALHHLAGRLVWQIRLEGETTPYGVASYWGYGGSVVLDGITGERQDTLPPGVARDIAARATGASPAEGMVSVVGKKTLFYRYGPVPAYRVSFRRPHRVDVFVDRVTGEIGAIIGPAERLTRVFGGVPHFVSFPPLNSNRTVYWLLMSSLVAGVLTGAVTGLVYGVLCLWRQGRLAGSSRGSTEQTLRRWHHVVGIVLGTLIVTWGVSGILMIWYPTVDPSPEDRARVAPPPIEPQYFKLRPADALVRVQASTGQPVVVLEARNFLHRPVFEARHPSGRSTLVDARSGEILTPLPDSIVRAVVARYVGHEPAIERIRFLQKQDAYYYGLHERRRPLPVYRVDLAAIEPAPSPIYVGADEGELLGRVTADYGTFRWLGSAIHTFSFPALLERPRLWDLAVVVPALMGVFLSGTGLWLGALHLYHSVRRRRAQAT